MSGARKRNRTDATAHPLMEERLQEENDKGNSRAGPKLPLKKNSGEMELAWVRLWEEHLRKLLEKHPEHYRALRTLVEGQSEEVSSQQLRDLKEWGYLARDRTPHPDVQAIIKAAARDTPDGPCLVNPVDVQTQDAADTLQRLNEQRDERGAKRMYRLLRKLRDQGDGQAR